LRAVTYALLSIAQRRASLDDFHRLDAAAKAGQIPVADDPLR